MSQLLQVSIVTEKINLDPFLKTSEIKIGLTEYDAWGKITSGETKVKLDFGNNKSYVIENTLSYSYTGHLLMLYRIIDRMMPYVNDKR